MTAGLLYNNYHSPYDGISALVPQQSTIKRNTIAWLPYLRDQQSLPGGALLDVGIGYVRIRDGFEPHGNSPYQITPELAQGSYFESDDRPLATAGRERKLYLPPRQWMGRHDLKAGIDLDHVGYDQKQLFAPVSICAKTERSSARVHSLLRQPSRCTTRKLARTLKTGGARPADG